MSAQLNNLPCVLDEAQVLAALPELDTRGALARMFQSLANGRAVQPPQTLTLFPDNAGDFITYLGTLADEQVFGAKLSPYVPTSAGPIVTAWTALMSMETGRPLMWCDSGLLTAERTAGATALAVEHLARRDAGCLALIGTGALGLAHLRHLKGVRAWQTIRVYSPELATDEAKRDRVKSIDPRVLVIDSIEACVRDADVVSLCTSSGKPVLTDGMLTRPALVTSISTNVANAHEVPPAWLPEMEVYCDYRATTPMSAGEMKIAAAEFGWSKDEIVGDLPELVGGRAQLPSYERHAFFRSIGLGLEDIAVAAELYRLVASTSGH
ncbi:ornithine cyclodeaminase family protein [Burkholderia cepacia]|uniref:ornithine cyclodeaminase family protein n=1 Tax=Burkholderia cepacia TaxID=292 RepID=UPI000F59FE94|nr:ornithine cyclodeaminase family protein [Burkholderia cepacia]RQT46055.1 ornithine cyclodeaminase family protein [Burkholderia cepacia]